ncbi:MAG: hypothetical protein KIT47_21680 [Rhodoferax sp.]|nr:hypothetical protein [Rhodoferax sp.]
MHGPLLDGQTAHEAHLVSHPGHNAAMAAAMAIEGPTIRLHAGRFVARINGRPPAACMQRAPRTLPHAVALQPASITYLHSPFVLNWHGYRVAALRRQLNSTAASTNFRPMT